MNLGKLFRKPSIVLVGGFLVYLKLWRRCKYGILDRRFVLTNFKSKREFYRDSIFKNRIISIDLSGELRKELREFSSLVSRNSANLNQITKAVNSTGVIYNDDIESIKKALRDELLFLSEFREKVSDYIINEVIG